ncbi:MAG: hypothetical protein KBH07_06475 [Flavobacteriales bacterium]|nr:hypothetical protein [Flavobacteriales bacterium]MBP9079570.1 hypothetical protein [Flavobacteriales bacterium]
MATSEQRKLIRSKIEAGASPQQVYDELHGPGNAADEQLADLVRYVPTLERRAEYRTAQLVLLFLLALAIAWKAGIVASAVLGEGWSSVVFNSALGIGYAIALLAVAKYWRQAHSLAGLLAFMDILHDNDQPGSSDGMVLPVILLFGVLAVLSLYLQRMLAPDYIKVKEPYVNADGQKRLKQVVRFGD